MEWAGEALGGLSSRPASWIPPSPVVFVDAVSYVQRWMPCTDSLPETIRWQAEVDPDELEYLVHAFFSLDTQLPEEVRRGVPEAPDESRTFYLVLVRALLHALETQSPSRAAFVAQLRSSWPIADEAN
jgi:hypothetical protein